MTKKPTLLIVDDVEANREALVMRLDLAGYDDCISVGSGADALRVLREKSIDLVLLDIMMPDMDGYEVLEELQADPALRDMPVIVISAVGDIDSVVRCIELGAADYLMKPFNPTILKARLDTYVRQIHLKAQETAYYQRIEEEKERSETLLRMLLPRQIADILQANDRITPIKYNDVAVLFCDVTGFTEYAENNPPGDVFLKLEGLIEQFEAILDHHELMKIKTIGDALMATGGLLEPLGAPVRAAVAASHEMVELAKQEGTWQVRVGIDHGPVIAGTLGRRQFQFDVWGDTVNTAARIEAIGKPGTVNLSGRAWQTLHGQARGRSLGLVDLKGKEPLEVIRCDELT